MITETNIISPNSVALISIHDSPFAYNASNMRRAMFARRPLFVC
jgi:hypothetical protein